MQTAEQAAVAHFDLNSAVMALYNAVSIHGPHQHVGSQSAVFQYSCTPASMNGEFDSTASIAKTGSVLRLL